MMWGVDDIASTGLPSKLPFVLQPNEETLEALNSFLVKVGISFRKFSRNRLVTLLGIHRKYNLECL